MKKPPVDTLPSATPSQRNITTDNKVIPLVHNKEQGARERILEASLKLFVSQGYFNTNVPDISKASKCSIGSIYHHFLNKEEIADCLYRDGIRQFRVALSNAIDSEANLETTIKAIVIAFLSFAETHELLARYLWLSRHAEFISKNVSRPTTVGFDKLGRKLTSMIKNAFRRNEIHAMKAEVIWNTIFGIPLSYTKDWLDGYTSEKPTEVAQILANASWCALKGVALRDANG